MRGLALVTVLLMAPLAGCIDSDKLPTGGDDLIDVAALPPEVAIPDVVTRVTHVAHTDSVPTGAGIWVDGRFAYVSARGEGFRVIDILDPEHPTVVGMLPGSDAFYTRDMDMYWTQGRAIVVGAGQGTGMHFIDVTDPAAPVLASTVTTEQLDDEPVHNIAAVTGTTLVYNSPSTGEGHPTHIVDGADPANPRVVGSFGDHGCHDIVVRVDLSRAYCAGVQQTQIWDITDPLAPIIVSRFTHPLVDTAGQVRRPILPLLPSETNDVRSELPYSFPFRGLHHSAMANHDGTVMIVGDEWQGGGEPGACIRHVTTATGQTFSTPMGAIFFVDVSDEANPELLGWFSPSMPDQGTPDANCTSHFGELLPDREQILMGWYSAGVVVVDFTDPANPTEVTRWTDGSDTWDAQIHRGWIITGDIARGSDVLKFE